VLFDIFTERGEAAYPDVFRVEITFYSPALKRNFSADAVLDLGMYRGALHSVRRDLHDVHSVRRDLHDVHEQLGAISRTLARWTHADGLSVMTRDDRKRYRKELEARYENKKDAVGDADDAGDSPPA
jgi:hypothetical protein